MYLNTEEIQLIADGRNMISVQLKFSIYKVIQSLTKHSHRKKLSRETLKGPKHEIFEHGVFTHNSDLYG
jgi:hypothetical protein